MERDLRSIQAKVEPAHDIIRPGAGVRGLHAIFSPTSIAVIGASERTPSVGSSIFRNVTNNQFRGTVFPVNPKHATIFGMRCYPNVAALPTKADLAVIVTPAASVPDVVRECGSAGVKAAIVISAGFREIGAAGLDLEHRVIESAHASGIRIVGPNCLGVMSPSIGLNATFASTMPRSGNIGFVSQSGALGTAILDWSTSEAVGFSHFASLGSMADVGWGDVIDFLGDDSATKSIILYMESIGNPQTFISAAREVAISKPIIIIKGGRTAAAAHAAASHTGALVGSDDVADAVFRRCGVLRVASLSDLFYMAEALAKQPRPKGRRLLMVTNAGGAGVLATDALVAGGGEVAQLSEGCEAGLNAFLPRHWSHGNPVDILGDATPERYERAVEICSREESADGLLVVLAPQGVAAADDVARSIQRFADTPGKPVIAAWMGGGGVATGAALLKEAGIPTYSYPDTASRVFNYTWHYDESIRALYEAPVADRAAGLKDRSAADRVISAALGDGRTLLTEYESKIVLAAYGIPTIETRLAKDADEAVLTARALGYPVAIKLHSLTITHKSDVGGVVLNINDDQGVREAFQLIMASVQERALAGSFSGVTVQPMVDTHADGYEVILGSSVDQQFGPILLFGLGGELVEVLRDRALGLPPLNTTLARRMMEQTSIYKAFLGIRGRQAVDLAALEQLLVRFGDLVIDEKRIQEIDVNPLSVSAHECMALDARIVLWPSSVPTDDLPRPAIRPYPSQYVSHWTTRTDRQVVIRPIRPEDEPLVAQFHERLSEMTVYERYAQALSLTYRVEHQRLSRLCFIDYTREMALVGIEGGTEHPTVIAIGRLIRSRVGDEAEFALTVQDSRQHEGLGTELLRRLVDITRSEKWGDVVGYILEDNVAMLRVCTRLGFVTAQLTTDGMVTVRLSADR